MSLLWLDIETTGLSANKNSILEVAAIVTTDDFQEVARIQRVVYYPHARTIEERLFRAHFATPDGLSNKHYQDIADEVLRFANLDIHPIVLKMHDRNGLWRDCINGLALDTIDRELVAFVQKHAVTTEEYVDAEGKTKTRKVTPQLAGSTISFDRAFIDAHLPRLADESVLHYRNLDVSTLNEVAKRCFQDLYNTRPNAGQCKENAAHRGMADIEESIRVFHHYRRAFGKGILSYFATGGTTQDLVAP